MSLRKKKKDLILEQKRFALQLRASYSDRSPEELISKAIELVPELPARNQHTNYMLQIYLENLCGIVLNKARELLESQQPNDIANANACLFLVSSVLENLIARQDEVGVQEEKLNFYLADLVNNSCLLKVVTTTL